MLILGEVRTSLLPTSVALAPSDAERVLALTAGSRATRSARPISVVVSPDRLTGVDCQIPVAADRTVRAIGTVAGRVVLTGGHVLQGSARAVVGRSADGRRLPWSHYLARRGTIEAFGRFRQDDLATGFLVRSPVAALLNMYAIGAHAAERVQENPMLDMAPPLRAGPTALRWAAVLPGDEDEDNAPDSISFVLEADDRRTVRLRAREASVADAVALCEELALHDWLLTTLTGVLDRAGPDLTGTTADTERIRSVVGHLVHLWMPGARLATAMRRFWPPLAERSGFDRQWTASVQRIRDHLALRALRR